MTNITSPDDFAATNPAEVAMTRRRLLMAAGAAASGIFLGGLAVEDAFAATKKTTKKTTKKSSTTTSAASTASTATAAATSTACAVIPTETGGPYPGDGTNGVNILTQSGVVRRDIRPSFGSMTGTATGVPLTINLMLRKVSSGCAAYPDAAVYLWHCDINGQYSLYTIPSQNYLRGVQAADANGLVTFTSIFPAAYSGRWPHIHFEVYTGVDAATSGRNAIKTSQLALPEAICNTVYATSGYATSVRNMSSTSLASDNVFSDGWASEMATVTGDVTNGYVANLTVNV